MTGPEDLIQPTPTPAPGRRPALIGALVGIMALAGTIVGVGAVAGAQGDSDPTPAPPADITTTNGIDDPTFDLDDEFVDEDWVAFDECLAEHLGDLWLDPGIGFDDQDIDFDLEEIDIDLDEIDFGDFDFGDEFDLDEFEDFQELDEETLQAWTDAEEACFDLLPDYAKADIEAWQPYEACIDEHLGDISDPWADGTEPTEAEWQAFDAAWQAANEACFDFLPEDAKAEAELWKAYDECLNDAGVLDHGFGLGSLVHVETADGLQLIEFGDEPGSVSISGDANGVTVSTEGGVTVFDEEALDAQWEAIDAAHEECERLLPDFFEDDDFEGDFPEFDDEFDDEFEG